MYTNKEEQKKNAMEKAEMAVECIGDACDCIFEAITVAAYMDNGVVVSDEELKNMKALEQDINDVLLKYKKLFDKE